MPRFIGAFFKDAEFGTARAKLWGQPRYPAPLRTGRRPSQGATHAIGLPAVSARSAGACDGGAAGTRAGILAGGAGADLPRTRARRRTVSRGAADGAGEARGD